VSAGRGEAPHHLGHDIALHGAEQQGFLLLLGECHAFAVADVAAEQQLGRRNQLAAGCRAQLEDEAHAQLHFPHLPCRRAGDHNALARIGDGVEHHLRLRERLDHRRGLAGVDVRAQLIGEGRVRRKPAERDRSELELGRAPQLEAAARECGHRDSGDEMAALQ